MFPTTISMSLHELQCRHTAAVTPAMPAPLGSVSTWTREMRVRVCEGDIQNYHISFSTRPSISAYSESCYERCRTDEPHRSLWLLSGLVAAICVGKLQFIARLTFGILSSERWCIALLCNAHKICCCVIGCDSAEVVLRSWRLCERDAGAGITLSRRVCVIASIK